MAIYPSKKKTPITSITPSNISPVSISAGTNYTPSESGVVVKGVTEVTPSDSNPPQLYKTSSSQGPYKIAISNGNYGFLTATRYPKIKIEEINIDKNLLPNSIPANDSTTANVTIPFSSFTEAGQYELSRLTRGNFVVNHIGGKAKFNVTSTGTKEFRLNIGINNCQFVSGSGIKLTLRIENGSDFAFTGFSENVIIRVVYTYLDV